mgnify:CR=1 FL=1
MTSVRRKSTAAGAKRRKPASRSARQARKAVTRSGRKAAARRPKRAVRKSATPRLTVVTGKRTRRSNAPGRAASPAPSFPQRQGASPKQLVMFEIVRARAAVLGAIQGLTAGSANQPMDGGKWSVRETVLHLVTRDQARMREAEGRCAVRMRRGRVSRIRR